MHVLRPFCPDTSACTHPKRTDTRLIVIFSAFHCHHDGSPAVLYAPQHQVLISGGKRGDVCIFDVRQRQIKHTFQAHDSAIRCMTLDPTEQYFVTGAADGDIKVRSGPTTQSVQLLFLYLSTCYRRIGLKFVR